MKMKKIFVLCGVLALIACNEVPQNNITVSSPNNPVRVVKMKKDASKLMTQARFWALIEQSNKGENLTKILRDLSDDEIFGYYYWWRHFNAISYKQDLWAVAYVVMGGCSDDCFDYFRFWLVAQGRKTFENAMNHADSLSDVFAHIKDGDYPESEDLNYVPVEIIEQRYGEGAFDKMLDNQYEVGISYPELVFLWDEDNPNSIRKICPNTFDKWWGNSKF